jgi:N-succinyldiaminopimelate aminotransferase
VNPFLEQLQPYPFERLNALKAGTAPPAGWPAVMLSIGEPRHPPPDFVIAALSDHETLSAGLGSYPATRGSSPLRAAISDWLAMRYGMVVDPDRQVLPVSGTREALFSFAQAMLDGSPESIAVLPNPFYQIYEGAVLLRGARPYFVNCDADNGYLPDYRHIPDSVWRRCRLVYVCSPGNPTGATVDLETLTWLLDQADRYNFVVAADECYAEIYLDENHPPPGLLQAAAASGRSDFHRCVVFHSLSKRSNLPGLRSGFVAGDADLLAPYFQYRTYQGSAMPDHVQKVSAAAWRDETHVRANRAAYRAKFEAVTPILESVVDLRTPDGGFYHWMALGENDETFARDLFAERNITVLPGSYLSREAHGVNPGAGHVRIAWVAPLDDCIAAATTIAGWLTERRR